ncbi:MAG TPA: hypothetical protein VFQ05_18920 [Candidatus Eisenbacteria bacterium]|nr:hypothetical protein [Candidatus Eisenbacteria bacterium]
MSSPVPDQDHVGLCARCRHSRTVKTRTSLFWMCERSKTDSRFPKYPRLPVLSCMGFEVKEVEKEPSAGEGPNPGPGD